jgi:hypothetical protein
MLDPFAAAALFSLPEVVLASLPAGSPEGCACVFSDGGGVGVFSGASA